VQRRPQPVDDGWAAGALLDTDVALVFGTRGWFAGSMAAAGVDAAARPGSGKRPRTAPCGTRHEPLTTLCARRILRMRK